MVDLKKDDLFGVKLIVRANGRSPLQGFYVLLNRHTFDNADIRTSGNNSI
jgi:hypothetical protein